MDVDTLINRNPLSAESYIYRNRIGLHPESLAEMQDMLDQIQRQIIGNRITRTLKRFTRIKTHRKDASDLRGPGVKEFIAHYVDPVQQGNDAKRTADVLVEIANLPKFQNSK
jgi:hypothetical protein